MASKKKDGVPDSKYYEAPDTVQMFDPIRSWLNKYLKKYSQVESFTNKYLSSLCAQLMQFQEDAFGKNAKSPALTKIPIKCFQDFKPGGGLSHILGTVIKYRLDQGLRCFDFQNPSRMDRNVEMFILIEKSLVQNGCLTRPVLFLSEDITYKSRLKLSEIVYEHQGTVTKDKSAATHIVHPTPADSPSKSEEYISVIEKKEKHVLIHHWFYPYSYDSWISVNESTTDHLSLTPPHEGVWKVHEQWVSDLDIYNEWMNEFDYEVTNKGDVVPPIHAKRVAFARPAFSKLHRPSIALISIFSGCGAAWLLQKELSVVNANQINYSAVVTEADRLYTSGDDPRHLYEYLKPHQDSNNAEVLWRFARAARDLKLHGEGITKEEGKTLTYESFNASKKALELDDKNWAAHKWFAVTLGDVGDYEGTKAKISSAFVMKDHFERALQMNPNDATTAHCLGMWCLAFAELSYLQQKIAAILFATPPTSTYEEAIKVFELAEKIEPNFYCANLFELGKCYLRIKDYKNAVVYLTRAVEYKIVTEEDKEDVKKASLLLDEAKSKL